MKTYIARLYIKKWFWWELYDFYAYRAYAKAQAQTLEAAGFARQACGDNISWQ